MPRTVHAARFRSVPLPDAADRLPRDTGGMLKKIRALLTGARRRVRLEPQPEDAVWPTLRNYPYAA